jgi:putative nucleotidyltransferase with HDIG domain
MNDSNCETVIRPALQTLGGSELKRKAYLVPQVGTREPLALNAPQLVIGRGDDVNYRLADPQASRHHVKLLAVYNRYYVQDLGSANGTFLNGYRVENERLAHGDLLLIGSSLFRFEIGDDLDADYLKKLNLDAVTALAEAVDKKDPYTGSHSKAVAQVAERLARAMALDRATLERVRLAGRLHDIGKIGVPDAVLRKTERLTDEEFDLIRRHPVDGEAILSPLASLADLLPAVRQHHERFDGTGYPDRLLGRKACLEARIIQVADTYHAMTSRRPYRDVQSLEFVQGEFTRHAGTQFDPEIVEIFLTLLPALYGASDSITASSRPG